MIRKRNFVPSPYDGSDSVSPDESDSRGAEFSDADNWQLEKDEAPPLATWSQGHEHRGQTYPGAGDPTRRVRKFIPEHDDTFVPEDDETESDDLPSPAGRRPVLARIMSVVLLASIGSGGAALWFYYGPTFSAGAGSLFSARTSEGDNTAAVISRLADEQRQLAQAVAALRQSVQDSLQKDAAARAQDTQRLSAQADALRVELDGLRAALANPAARPPVAHAAKSAAVPPQKKGSERKPAPGPQAEPQPITPSPEH